jgi:hypothetical protein
MDVSDVFSTLVPFLRHREASFMARLTCPNCGAVLGPSDLTAGWCDSCGKKIPATVIAAAPAPRKAAREVVVQEALPPVRSQPLQMRGMLFGALAGGLVFLIVAVWPLRSAGLIYLAFAAFVMILAGLSVGMMAEGMFTKSRR